MKSRIVQGLAVFGLLGGSLAAGAGTAVAASGHTLFVFDRNAQSVAAHDQSSGCGNAKYSTIAAAVAAASPGDTVVVCPGTYPEDVVVGKALTLEGHGATIDAAGQDNAIQVLVSGVTVEGFTATGAIGEGILVGALPQRGPVPTVSGVTIRNNIVVNNDQGSASYGQCVPANGIPGDCGEGIHLLSTEDSTVTGNQVSGNSGGILLSDENGPSVGNTISSNVVSGNLYDCGITVAGHRPLSFGGGIYDNTISANQVTDNGVAGQGAGVLLASGVPGNIPGVIPGIGGAVFDNLVEGNYLAGNGLAGVTVHSHSPGEDLNGNVIRNNTIDTNNLDGDPDFYPAVDPSTTGVIVASVAPLSITIAQNLIMNNVYGIWITAPAVTVSGTSSNTFVNVTTPVGP
jgi:parallel beta-helix repeat protein